MKLLFALLLLTAMSFVQSREQRLDQVFDHVATGPMRKGPGFAVLVLDHGKIAYERTVGVTDLKTKTPITPTTNFRLASCTKQFTAMSIMLLVHDGKLRYDETLTEVFPDFPAYGKKITIRNLLNHTSGLPDYEDLMELPANKGNNWSATHQITDAEVLRLLEQTPTGEKGGSLKFPPGTQWSYSNSGYVILGNVVAKISGKTFPQFLHDRIFAALKMDNTVAFVNGVNTVANRAYGHSLGKMAAGASYTVLGYVETDQSSTSATLGDGGVYSNLKDLAKWDVALMHNTLLSEAEMLPALTPFKLPDGSLPKWSGDSGDEDPQHGKPVAYGFGWFLDAWSNSTGYTHERMWHYGDTVGFKSAIVRFPKDGITVIVLTNRSDLNAPDIAMKFADAYFGK